MIEYMKPPMHMVAVKWEDLSYSCDCKEQRFHTSFALPLPLSFFRLSMAFPFPFPLPRPPSSISSKTETSESDSKSSEILRGGILDGRYYYVQDLVLFFKIYLIRLVW